MYYATLFEKMPEVYLFSFKGQTTQRNVKSTTTKNPNSCSVPKVELWTLKEKKKKKKCGRHGNIAVRRQDPTCFADGLTLKWKVRGGPRSFHRKKKEILSSFNLQLYGSSSQCPCVCTMCKLSERRSTSSQNELRLRMVYYTTNNNTR